MKTIGLHLSGPMVPADLRPERTPCAPAPNSRIFVSQHIFRNGAEVLVEVEGVVDRVDWYYPHNATPFLICHLRSL